MDSGPDEHVTTQTTEPPAWMAPYLQSAFQRGDELYQSRPLYTGPTFRPDELAGMEQIRDVATNPLLTGGAYDYAQDVIGGEYLDPAAIREAAAPAIGQALQGVRSGFEGAGGRGGSMEAIATGEGVTRALAPYYEAERARQHGAAFGAPALEASRYTPGEALMGLGGAEDARIQQRYQEPWQRYQMSLAPFGGNPSASVGGTSTATQPVYQPSPFGQILGLGMAGAGLAGNFGWSPFSKPPANAYPGVSYPGRPY